MNKEFKIKKLRSLMTLLAKLRIKIEKIIATESAWYLETSRGIIRLSEFGLETFGGYPKLVDYKLYFTMSDNSITSALIRR